MNGHHPKLCTAVVMYCEMYSRNVMYTVQYIIVFPTDWKHLYALDSQPIPAPVCGPIPQISGPSLNIIQYNTTAGHWSMVNTTQLLQLGYC